MAHKYRLELSTRQFRPSSDILPYLRLRNAMATANGSDKQYEKDEILNELNASNHDPEKDRWIGFHRDTPEVFCGHALGYHTLPERYLAWLEVHPKWRRNGLGTLLFADITNRAKNLATDHVLVNSNANDETARAFLTKIGFKIVAHSWFMSNQDDFELPKPEWPTGFTVHSFAEIQDFQHLQDAYFESCRYLWGNGANSRILEQSIQPVLKDWSSWFTTSDPNGDGIFIVYDQNGLVAGICRGFVNAATNNQFVNEPGLVDALGVVPKYRSRGLHRPLTLTVMHWLRAHGHRRLTLEQYGADEETVALYRSLGFALDRCDAAYCYKLNTP